MNLGMGRRGVNRDIISRVEPKTTDALRNIVPDQEHNFVLWFGEPS